MPKKKIAKPKRKAPAKKGAAKRPRAKAKTKAPVAKSQPPSAEAVKSACEKALETYSSRPEVTAIDTGFKYDGGKRTDEIVVRIHIAEKKDESVLEAAEIFPKEIDGVPVDVIQAKYRLQQHGAAAPDLASDRRVRRDPIQPGISIAHHRVSAGTFGALVYDQATGAPHALSNWHVLVGNNGSPGDSVLQPGPADSGRLPADKVGEVERYVLGPAGDAAIASLDRSRAVSGIQFETGAQITTSKMPAVGMIVHKSGRTTDVTRGKVDGVGRYFINYGGSQGRVGIDGFKVVPELDGNPHDDELSRGGDSGSVWYEESAAGEAAGVGLHFAGETSANPSQEHAIACNLPSVMEELKVTLEAPAVEIPGADVTRQVSPLPASSEPTVAALLKFMESQNQLLHAVLARAGERPDLAAAGEAARRQVSGRISFDETLARLTQILIDRGVRQPFTRHDNAHTLVGNSTVLVQRVINDNFFPGGGGFSTDDLGGSETIAQLALLIVNKRNQMAA